MNFLEERIQKDGIVKEGNVLKVDSFLNHQMDIELFEQMGQEFACRFKDAQIDKILTIDCLYCGQVFRRTGSVREKGKEREPGRGDVHSGSGVLYP